MPNAKTLSTANVVGVQISTETKKQLLSWIEARVNRNEQTFLATPYGEFLYEALRNPEFRWILNEFDANIADGVSVQWAATFLSLRGGFATRQSSGNSSGLLRRSQSIASRNDSIVKWYASTIRAFWQMVITGSWILLAPQKIKKIIPEKITGSDLIWDLAELAEKNNWSVMLAGGFGDTVEIAKNKLLERFPKLNVVGTSSVVIPDTGGFATTIRDPGFNAIGVKEKGMDPSLPSAFVKTSAVVPATVETGLPAVALAKVGMTGGKDESSQLLHQIQTLKPDVLLLCIGPFKQERFLIYNREKLPVKLTIGLGGTFDYIAGRKKNPPRFIRNIGLEWLFRLTTQPQRWKRIYNATFNLVISLIKYKVYQNKPYRQNVVAVVISENDKILVCRRNTNDSQKPWKGRSIEGWNIEHWQLPQGGIDKNEALEMAALREVEEETGLKSLQIIGIAKNTNEYVFPMDHLMPLFGPNKYKGQSQSLVYLRYLGNESDVKVDQDEFDEYDWVSKEELIGRLHPVRKELGKIVLENWIN